MLVKLLKTTRPTALLFFFGVSLFLWALNLLHLPTYSYAETGYPLFDLLQLVLFQNQWIAAVLALALSLLLSMGLNNLITEKGVLKNNTILPATILIIILSPFTFSPVWPAAFSSLFVLNKLLSMYQQDRPYSAIYDAGFLVGVASLFYPPALFLFPVIYVANLTYSAFGWRNYVIPIVGLLSTYLLAGAYLFFQDNLGIFLSHYAISLSWEAFRWEASLPILMWGFFLLVLSLCSFKELAQWMAQKSLRSRKSFIIILSFLLCAVPAFFCVAAAGLEHLVLLSIPLATLAGNYLLFARKWWWYETLFIAFLFSAIHFHLAAVFGW